MIIAGTSTSEVIVETQIEGEGETYTHVETEVNGQKQVFETDQPGRYEIKVEATASASPQFRQNQPRVSLNLRILINQIRNFLSRLFYFNRV